MKRRKVLAIGLIVAIAFVFFWLTFPGHSERQRTGTTRKVGAIYIVGNTTTSDVVILGRLSLYPGQAYFWDAVVAGEEQIVRQGLHAKVSILNAEQDDEFQDILVEVQETPLSWVRSWLGL